MEIKITETGEIKQLKMSAQKSYRQFEFDQLIDVTLSSSAPTCDFKIQIRSDEGSTKWLNITPSELAAIRETLTKSKATNGDQNE